MPRKRSTIPKSKHGIWKLIDDRTGFAIYSDEAVVDGNLDGVITTKKYADPYDIFELPRYFPPNEGGPVPYSRPEPNDTYIATAYYVWNNTTKTWELG